ncbi:MAG: transcriptional antiterminator, Rof [Thiobacillus sp.]|nr:transcriptional antiterminator, Rof [Thiobacillus sp.]
MKVYQPIACADHERLEYAVLKRQWLDVTVTSEGRQGRVRLLPRDVYTREGAEWLLAEMESGEQRVMRLDELELDTGLNN